MILVDTKTRDEGKMALRLSGNLSQLRTDLVLLLNTFLENEELECVLSEALAMYKNPEIRELLKDAFEEGSVNHD